MMQNLQKAIWLMLTILLSSCVQSTNPQFAPSATISSTAQSIAVPSPISTATQPYFVPTSNLVTPTPTFFVPLATEPSQQTYIDPAGWFSVNLPAAWESTSANVFSGKDGFFETGYLPEMMYMKSSLDVCQWLANINTNSVYSIIYGTTLYLSHNARTSCTLKTVSGISPATSQAILENPHVTAEQRFFYIKTDPEHYEEIIETFVWLRPVDRSQGPAFKSMPMRPEDVSFWENTAPNPSILSITEYILPQEVRNESPTETEFSRFKPDDVPTMESKAKNNSGTANEKPSIVEQLMSYGYEVRKDPKGIKTYQLYKDGNLLLDKIDLDKRGVYIFSSSTMPIVALVVETTKYECYLIQDNTIIEMGGCFHDPRIAPVLHKGELLWVREVGPLRVQVETSRRDVLFSFATYFDTRLPVQSFDSWNDHWILEVADFLIQDGEIQNEKFGFEEAFDWQIVNDKPFYFFRKGPRFGISYDGNFLPLDYDEIPHDFCCGLTGNNPSQINENSVRFYGKRDGTWYYVIAEAH